MSKLKAKTDIQRVIDCIRAVEFYHRDTEGGVVLLDLLDELEREFKE